MFQNFVSLGQACSVASSMSKYGLRSWSGPFDWLVTSNFNWVLHYIENEFEDFLPREYLRRLDDYESNDRQFRDEQSGFMFNHDCEYAFEEQYEELKQKYQRRIEKFLEATASPTCFLRNIVSQNEIDYISSNQDYINRVIKKRNSQNEIVFIADYGLRFPAGFLYKSYRIPVRIHTGGGHFTYNELRSLFDGLDEFLEWCAQNYDSQSIIKGIMFDRQKEKIYQQQQESCLKMYENDARRYHILIKLLNWNMENLYLPKKIVVYGAGNIGKIFKQKVSEKCVVKYFVDREKRGKYIDGIPVKGIEGMIEDADTTLVVTVTYDYENIYRDVKSLCPDATIISLEDILKDNTKG